MDENNSSEYQFIKETIKERPINKNKLLLRFIMIIIAALIFGAISAGVFIMMVRQSIPTEKENTATVVIPRDDELVSVSEDDNESTVAAVSEDSLEELAASEEIAEVVAEEAGNEDGDGENESDDAEKAKVTYITQRVSISVPDYKDFYRTLKNVASETCRSIVTVTAITSDTDWFDNSYENSDNNAGLIIANNGKELLILSDMPSGEKDMHLNITFCDDTTLPGEVKATDEATGLAVITVLLDSIPESTGKEIKEARLGNSKGPNVVGMPVMALGSPLGTLGSQCFGRTTSNQREISMADRNVHILSTDIYGSRNATGVITDYDGQILGIISQNTSMEDAPNLLTAYAISDIKGLIEKLSNNSSETYLGIYGADVTETINEEEGVPMGLYITKVDLDSPALDAGIQSGDVITRFGTVEITSFKDYMDQMLKYQPGDETVITVQRYSKGEYQEMTFDVTIDDAKDHTGI